LEIGRNKQSKLRAKKTRSVATAGESTLEENLREASVYLPVWEPPIPYSWDIEQTLLFFCKIFAEKVLNLSI
jgi:hypothetical protein